MNSQYVLADDGTRVFATEEEEAEADLIVARHEQFRRDVADTVMAFETECRAFRQRLLARAAAEAKAEESDA